MAQNNSNRGGSSGGKQPAKKTGGGSQNKKGAAKAAAREVEKRQRTLITVVVIIIVLVIIGFFIYDYFYGGGGDGYEYGEGDAAIHFLDVGQGDCIIIQLPDGKNMIIDSGDNVNAVKTKIKNYISKLEISCFDYVMLTHADADHSGGFPAVFTMNGVTFGEIYMPRIKSNAANDPLAANDKTITTAVYQNFVSAAVNTGADIIYSTGGVLAQGDGYKVTIYTPVNLNVYNNISNNSSAEAKNGISPIMILEYNGRRAMFTGDANKDSEEVFLDYVSTMRIEDEVETDVLKVAHHGSEGSSSQNFLTVVSPEYAVISVGTNSYTGSEGESHPHNATLRRLQNIIGMQAIYRTDEVGDIVCTFTEDSEILWYNSRDGLVTVAVVRTGEFAGVYLCLKKSV